MKRLFRGVVILSFITVTCVIAYVLLLAMKKLYIESWFFLDRSVIIGFLSGLILTCVISLINFHHALCDHARERASMMDKFAAEAESFQKIVRPLQSESGAFTIPDHLQPALALALTRLDESAGKIMRAERISPLKSATIEKRGRCASALAQTELAFDRAFAPFSESCTAAFHAHSMLPYLESESERQNTQQELLHSLNQMLDALSPASDFMKAWAAYRRRIDRFLGSKPAIKPNKLS